MSNNLNQLIKETKPGNEITTYSYDDAGNLAAKISPRDIREEYSYYSNGLVDKIDYYSSTTETTPAETINYQYDRTGNRTLVEKEESSIAQSYDLLGRITAESRTIAGKTYTTKYRYDKYGNLTGIKYPKSNEYLSYGYDELNQLKWIKGIAGDKDNPAFVYNQNGQLTEMLYDNGVETSYGYNALGRPESIVTNRTNLENNTEEEILNLNYQYDKVGNVKVRNNNSYNYDSLNRLERAEVEGDFYLENQGTNGRALEDYLGEEELTFTPEAWEYECDFGKRVALDYNSGSIGVAFEQEIRNITRLELKTLGIADHRVSKRTLEIYYSDNNVEYTKLAEEDWKYEKDYKGDITLTILKSLTAKYIKVHSKFVDWDGDFEVIDESQFVNGLEHMIKVYSKDDGAAINYEYDSVGNRTKKVLRTLSGNMKEYEYHYYSGTNRLKDYTINGKNAYAYVYDDAGNLVKKGNKYNIEGNSVTFIETEGQSVEYFEYEYNLQNRLFGVKKNGEIIAEFAYDADGMRIKAVEQLVEDEDNRTTYYVYVFSGKVLMEESSDSSSGSEYTSYVYAFGKSFAKVEGVIDTAILANAKLSYFHYDNLGSTRLMTDRDGKITFDQDYLPFGGDLPRIGQVEVQNDTGEGYKYTGQKQVVSIGLYYYGARYYDPEIGRFITEDTYFGQLVLPQSQNLYVYTLNNPMRYIDPTGLFSEDIGSWWESFSNWWNGYGFVTDENIDDTPLIDWQSELATNIEQDLSKWNFSEETSIAESIITNMIIKNNTKILKRKYIQIKTGFLALDPKQRRMKRELNGLFDIETSDAPRLLKVAAEGFSFGFYQGLAESVVSASRNSLDPYDLLNGTNNRSNLFWGKWSDYEKVTIDGREYAKIGNKYYTHHAVDRMQPSGMRYSAKGSVDGGKVRASRIFDVDQLDYGRSISPNFVDDVIENGKLVDTPLVNGVRRQVYQSGSVQVITEGDIVITIITK